MEDISQLIRSGVIGSEIQMKKLKNGDGTLTPFCYFDVTSEIEGVQETLHVLLQGSLCEPFAELNPQMGNQILLLNVTPYTKDGQLCTRIMAKNQFRLMPERGLMPDVSRLTQSGTIGTEIQMKKLKNGDGALVPFCYFDLISSEIDNGSATKDETLRVLLQGELCEYFMGLNPKKGDHMLLLHVSPYIKDGQLCTRLAARDQFQLVPTRGPGETFGLPAEAFVPASKLFGG